MNLRSEVLEDKETLRIEKPVYGGDGLARTGGGEIVLVPFALPGELVRRPGAGETAAPVRILEASPDRVEPRCVHFGICGGCQYQMASYDAQLRMKEAILRETLERAGLEDVPRVQVWGSPEPYEYRNRIRLRVREVDGSLRLGYSVRGSKNFLPVVICPIAAPVLWRAAEALMLVAAEKADCGDWIRSAAEVEVFCDDAAHRVQIHLLCPGAVPKRKGSFERLARGVAAQRIALVSLGASRLHIPSGRAMEPIAFWGAEGLSYRVGDQNFWLERGSFFQVNRFLLPQMVQVVCEGRKGHIAWDLYAGAGLFARELSQSFEQVTAIEANPRAIGELQRGLRHGRDLAVRETSLEFLRKAVVQRERPELIVLDPPRAGAGEEACGLLARLRPAEIVYVSCDPTTLARDAAVLIGDGYRVSEIHMMDLFPQTYHLETVMVLRRGDVRGY